MHIDGDVLCVMFIVPRKDTVLSQRKMGRGTTKRKGGIQDHIVHSKIEMYIIIEDLVVHKSC
jgi:hypothetical protein